jgi:hypothetical protein
LAFNNGQQHAEVFYCKNIGKILEAKEESWEP